MRKIILLCYLLATLIGYAGDTVRPGLENIESRPPSPEERQFLAAVKLPLLMGMDVTEAMTDWFDALLLETQNAPQEQSTQKFQSAARKLTALSPLPRPPFAPLPDADFQYVSPLPFPRHPEVTVQVVQWESSRLVQYGVLLTPQSAVQNAAAQQPKQYPLFLYCHGAAFGVPVGFLDFLADMVEQGYVVIAPAMRGEPLFQMGWKVNEKSLESQGEIENLDGEVEDCLSMVSAAWKLPYVRPGEFGMIGHSFGAGVGLLAVARAGAAAKAVVSYDAWLVNPQRYYWDRMRRAARNWDSWEDFCNQPVRDQLLGLVKRSVILHSETIQCPLLLFIGGAYNGSVFHLSHQDFTLRLDQLKKPYRYVVVPRGDHNFVLRQGSAPARCALAIQQEYLQKHYPPCP